MSTFAIRSLTANDQTWLPDFFMTQWGSTRQVVRGAIFVPHELSGFTAELDGELVGVITYRFLDETTGEITTLNSLREGIGVGGALIRSVIAVMRTHSRRQLVVVTTNDNLSALRFYQKRGFVLAELRANALQVSRCLKPEIPLLGKDDIPLRDEIELALNLV